MTTQIAKPNPFARPLDIRRTLTTPPPVLEQVLPGLLAGTVAVCAGPGGMGKTTFLLQLCCALATGGSPCGGLFKDSAPEGAGARTPGKVVFVCAEESAAIIGGAVTKAGRLAARHPSRVHPIR